MTNRYIGVALLLLIMLVVSGCGRAQVETTDAPEPLGEATDEPDAESEEESVADYASLLERLRADDAEVEPAGEEIEQAFFSVPGQVVRVNGEDVQVFEYESKDTAQQEASTISPDGGSVGTTMVTWVDTPHFYQQEKLIVLYIGSNPDVLAALEAALGPQIAGGQ